MRKVLLILLFAGLVLSNINLVQAEENVYSDSGITFNSINHATFVIQTDDITIYVDPVGNENLFITFPSPDIILITDIHQDHLDTKLVGALKKEDTAVVGPQAVIEQLGFGEVIYNGESKTFTGINIEAIPMYNLTEDRLQFHPKGRGNGYVLTLNEKKVYISGDTEDIPEMRALKDIDHAFLCMNLPYTMTVEQAALAVLEFKPKVVIPYHYRGTVGMSDMDSFRRLVAKDADIKVVLLKWY